MFGKIGLAGIIMISVGTFVARLVYGGAAISAVFFVIAMLFLVPIGIHHKSVLRVARVNRAARAGLFMGFFIVFWIVHAAIVWELCVRERVATGQFLVCPEDGGVYCNLIIGLMNMVRVRCGPTGAACGTGLAHAYSAFHAVVLLIVCAYPTYVLGAVAAKNVSVELVRERYGKCRMDMSSIRGRKVHIAAIGLVVGVGSVFCILLNKIARTVECDSFYQHSLPNRFDNLLYGKNQFLFVVYFALGVIMLIITYGFVSGLVAKRRYRLRMSKRGDLGCR